MVVREDLSSLFEGTMSALLFPWCTTMSRALKKFLGNKRNMAENWSSIMLFNNSMCSQLTPQYVRGAWFDLSLIRLKMT